MSCIACGSDEKKILSKKKILEQEMDVMLCQCSVCKLCYVEPYSLSLIEQYIYQETDGMPSAKDLKRLNKKKKQLTTYARKYVLKAFKKYPFADVQLNPILTALLFPLKYVLSRNLIPYRGNGRLLDVGCNNGLTLELFKTAGWDAYGVEPRDGSCNQAKLRGLNVFHGVLDEAPYSEQFFDVIRYNQVFEHISDPITTLNTTRRLLAENGRIYIECPNQRSLFFHLFKDIFYCYPGHFYIYSPRTIDLLCRKAGLKMCSVRTRCTSGFLIFGLNAIYRNSNKVMKMLLFPFVRISLVKTLLLKPLCYCIQLAGWGDLFEVEISRDSDT